MVFVTRETIAAVLEQCTPTWRLIVKLARYAGLRTPSESLSLRWADIDLPAGRMIVRSPKTAHVGKASRVVPIFPEIREELEAAWDRAEDGAEFVLPEYRKSCLSAGEWKNANLRTQFERIILRAGQTPWPRLFHALRSSCETELAARFPVHVVTAWLGNTPKVAMKHYLLTTDADFASAAGLPSPTARKSGAESGAQAVQKAVRPVSASECQSEPGNEKTPGNPGFRQPVASTGTDRQHQQMAGTGFEPATSRL
ncbi:MAG: site-specific integrase [Planctomyces sp.]|nr:site-specific integrase [Planctomyces sp.]